MAKWVLSKKKTKLSYVPTSLKHVLRVKASLYGRRQKQLNISTWSGIKAIFPRRESQSTPLFRRTCLSTFRPSVFASFLNRRVIRFRSTTRLGFVRLLGPSSAWNNFVKVFDFPKRATSVCNTLYQTIWGMSDRHRKLEAARFQP